MKKIVALLLFSSTLSLFCASHKELRNECIEYNATRAAEAFIIFTNEQGNYTQGDIEVSISFFLESVREIAHDVLSIDPLTTKENRSASTPLARDSRPHPLMLSLIPIARALRTFNDEPDKALVADQFCKKVESHITHRIRSSTPAGCVRLLTPSRQE